MFKYLFFFSFLLTLSASVSQAKASDYAYFGFEPDIVTNYVTVKKKMGYVRLTVELMVEGDDLTIVEHHSPLLRDAIINIIGQQVEAKVKSMKGRADWPTTNKKITFYSMVRELNISKHESTTDT
jgi:flagellar FliL protein